MHITAEDYRALARSSPWLWRSVQLRWDGGPLVTMERPARVVVRDDGSVTRTDESPDAGRVPPLPGAGPGPERRRSRFVSDLDAERRPDGLVTARPEVSFSALPSQPMVHGYFSVAAVDPVELAAGVELSEVRVEELRGRETWVARCRAGEEYDPRCGCCPLIADRRIAVLEWGAERGAGMACHESVEIWLDRRTGIMTRWVPRPEHGAVPHERVEVDIRWVDGDFASVWREAAPGSGPGDD